MHCQVCDLIQLHSDYYLMPEREQKRYEEHNNTSDNEGYVNYLASFLREAVKPFATAGTTALDYGCGPGPVLQGLLQDEGIHTDIYDPFFYPRHPQKTYDLVTCTEALEHVFKPQEVWRNFLHLLKTGGHLCIMTRFHSGPESFLSWWYRRDPTHVSFYSPKTFAWIEHNFPLRIIFINESDKVVFKRQS